MDVSEEQRGLRSGRAYFRRQNKIVELRATDLGLQRQRSAICREEHEGYRFKLLCILKWNEQPHSFHQEHFRENVQPVVAENSHLAVASETADVSDQNQSSSQKVS